MCARAGPAHGLAQRPPVQHGLPRHVLALTVIVLLPGLALATPTLQGLALKAGVQVQGEHLTLGDVAQISPPQAAAELGGLIIGPAPPPGMSATLTVGFLRVRLRRLGLNLSEVTFSGPDRIVVTRLAVSACPSGPAMAPPGAERPSPAPPTIRRGALLKLVVRRGALTVEALGEALEACSVGQIGRFRVTDTRATVAACVTNPTCAEVVR